MRDKSDKSLRWWQWRQRNACPHSDLRPIYGDEIVFGTPNHNRLICCVCLRFLDGPVSLAASRATYELLGYDPTKEETK